MSGGVRIWHQSITDLDDLPAYRETLATHARQVCAADTSVSVHGVRPGSYPPGLTPIEAIRYPWCHRLLDLQIVQHAVTAQRQGFDAVAISCFFDPGLREARSLLDIPVVSMCETAFVVARTVGTRYGLIGLDGEQVHALRRLAAEYGVADRVVAVVPLDPPVTEPELDAVHGGGGDLVRRVEAAATAAADAGADVIIPAEGVLNTALARQQVRHLAGLPVLDAYAALLLYAESLVRLRNATGLVTSHVGAYAAPDEETAAHFARMSGEALVAPPTTEGSH